MAPRKKAPAKGARRAAKAPRPSGPTQPEAERKNPQLKLRLRRERAEEIRALAEEFGVTASAVVDAAMGAALASGQLVMMLSIAKLATPK